MSCEVCQGYPDEINRQIDLAGARHLEEMARIRALEAQGKPIERVFDAVGYHERVLTICEFDEDEAA